MAETERLGVKRDRRVDVVDRDLDLYGTATALDCSVSRANRPIGSNSSSSMASPSALG